MEEKLIKALSDCKKKKKGGPGSLDKVIEEAGELCGTGTTPSASLVAAISQEPGHIFRRAKTHMQNTDFYERLFLLIGSCLKHSEENRFNLFSQILIPQYQEVLLKLETDTKSQKTSAAPYLVNAIDIVATLFNKWLSKIESAKYKSGIMDNFYIKCVKKNK